MLALFNRSGEIIINMKYGPYVENTIAMSFHTFFLPMEIKSHPALCFILSFFWFQEEHDW